MFSISNKTMQGKVKKNWTREIEITGKDTERDSLESNAKRQIQSYGKGNRETVNVRGDGNANGVKMWNSKRVRVSLWVLNAECEGIVEC